jgi:arginyl-tRNA--protein-N-Asp/Glu arginylyltransferase
VEVLVRDELEPCVYLDALQARLPLRWQLRPVTGDAFDELLALGDRRVGRSLYRPSCPGCRACETIRVPVERFEPSRTQRRVWKRGQRELRVELCGPSFSEEHVALFNRHRRLRGLARHEGSMPPEGYDAWLVQTCCETVEIRYLRGDALVAVAITAMGARAASAVYTYFDPDHSDLSPGTYSVLWQIDWARRLGLEQLYLGLYIAGNRHMAYKVRFLPHQRRAAGEPVPAWEWFERG